MNASFPDLSPTMLVVLVIAIIVEFSLILFALVKWGKNHSNTIGGLNRYVWLPIIVLIQFLGAILFIIIASRETITDKPQSTGPKRTVDASESIDKLYGDSRD
jgi:hypothetical protein